MSGRPIAWLGRSLRRRRRHRAGPVRVAAMVAERRRPKRLAVSRRLAPRRVYAPPAPSAQAPGSGLSDFAARWMFGDGVAEGTPFAGGAAVEYGRPSFLAGPDEPAPAARPAPRRSAPGPARIEEVGPRFRLSRTPPSVPAPAPQPEAAEPTSAAHPAAAPEHDAAPAPGTPVVLARATVRRPPGEAPEPRPAVRVVHVHQPPEEEARRVRRGPGIATGVRAARVAEVAYELHRGKGMVDELEALGHRAADAARGEWSKLKKDAGQWRDRAEHELSSLKRRGERAAHGLERRATREVHGLEREGRGIERAVVRAPQRLERGVERGLAHAERAAVRDVGRFLRRSPLARAATSLVRGAGRDLARAGQFEQRALRAERGLEKALKEPEKELLDLGRRVEQQVLSRPVVRRAEAALGQAEREAGRVRRDLPQLPGAGAAKAAALAAAAGVPLEVSRAGRAVVQLESEAEGAAHRFEAEAAGAAQRFEAEAGRAAHRLEAEARHAAAAVERRLPHALPRVPHPAAPVRSAVAEPAGAAGRAAEAAERGADEAAHEHMYEQVVDRLRRDLLAERERMGNLLGEWP